MIPNKHFKYNTVKWLYLIYFKLSNLIVSLEVHSTSQSMAKGFNNCIQTVYLVILQAALMSFSTANKSFHVHEPIGSRTWSIRFMYVVRTFHVHEMKAYTLQNTLIKPCLHIKATYVSTYYTRYLWGKNLSNHQQTSDIIRVK